MTKASHKALTALGFLTVCDLEGLGLVGGYLLLDPAGRPLEFHCTAPLRPSRAQEILYGPTLAPFLYGDQIGRALVEKASTVPIAVFTDCAAALAVAPFVSAPVVLVGPDEAAQGSQHRFEIGANRLALPAARSGQADELIARLIALGKDLGEPLDLAEPFGRIREAIGEAQRDAKAKAALPRIADAA